MSVPIGPVPTVTEVDEVALLRDAAAYLSTAMACNTRAHRLAAELTELADSKAATR